MYNLIKLQKHACIFRSPPRGYPDISRHFPTFPAYFPTFPDISRHFPTFPALMYNITELPSWKGKKGFLGEGRG